MKLKEVAEAARRAAHRGTPNIVSIDSLDRRILVSPQKLAPTTVLKYEIASVLRPDRIVARDIHTDIAPEIAPQRKPSRKVLERLEKIQSLPRRKQDAILTTIDHFLNSAAS